MSEFEPDTENVVYLDEYPELKKKVWLRRLEAQRRMGREIVHMTEIYPFPDSDDSPDDIA